MPDYQLPFIGYLLILLASIYDLYRHTVHNGHQVKIHLYRMLHKTTSKS